ncbi:hypothetical protein VaNZ11_012003 [Volvox africanus]|uniref:EGF-like domain-containing protein n=1 Tax=Volvox africanus TaxID=51714 RepID=A0ABQ5SE45_9CHLO|nr:hypothetical protein VaNZ11_012003 [Volvox africanus]
MFCVKEKWFLPLLGLTLLLGPGALTQQSPITLTIEYQLQHNLTLGERVLLTSVVTAAYQTLQKYVLTKTSAAPLLCERVCRHYYSLEPSSQQLQQPPPPLSPSAAFAAAPSASVRCYPDFSASATDVRLQRCGLADINRAHVQDPTTVTAGPGAAGSASLAGGHGEVTDLYLYVTASPASAYCTEPNGKGMQFYTCMYDSTTGRPTMSSLNVCPQALNLYDVDSLVARALRELIRALGVERVGFFGLAPLETYMSYIVLDTDPAELPTRFLATPRVKQAVREFFECSSAPGALLEDSITTNAVLYDSSVVMNEGEVLDDPDYLSRAAVAFPGWETTHFQGDILIADSDPIPAAGTSPQVTPLTLALLKDTTWYDVVGSSEAGYWWWGRGRGCALATRHCFTLINNISASDGDGVPVSGGALTAFTGMDPDEVLFCDPATYGTGTRSCTPGGFSVGTCRTRPITTGSACGLITSVSPRVGTCTARELEVAELSAGDTAASATYGWTAGAASRCLPLAWPWIAKPLPDSAAAALMGVTAFPDPAPSPPVGASCFQMSCSSRGDLWVHVLGTAIPCPVGVIVNLTASDIGAAMGGRLTQALLGTCPNATAFCGMYGSGDGSSGVPQLGGCNPTATCSPRGGECRPANLQGSSPGVAMRCFCRPGYGGTACQQFLGATYDNGGGVVGEAVENLTNLASTFAVLEVSIRVQTALPDFLVRQSTFLDVIARVMSLDTSIRLQKLAVARVYGMSYIPSVAVGISISQGLHQEQSQVVVRFLAANAEERKSFRDAMEDDADRVLTELLNAQFPVEPGGISYLGEAAVRIPGPPSPPQPPLPPPSSSSPSLLPPSKSPSGKSNGRTGNEKVALGVGVTFGVILMLMLLVLVYEIWSSANAKQKANAEEVHSNELMGRLTNTLFSTTILNQPPNARAGSPTATACGKASSTVGGGGAVTALASAADQRLAEKPAPMTAAVEAPTSSSVPANFLYSIKALNGGGSGGKESPEIEPQVAMEMSNIADGREGTAGDNAGEPAPAAHPALPITAPFATSSSGGDSAKACDESLDGRLD